MSEPTHFMSRSHVTRFRGDSVAEVATYCGGAGCDSADDRWIYGRGDSLPECLADLTTNFNAHVEAS